MSIPQQQPAQPYPTQPPVMQPSRAKRFGLGALAIAAVAGLVVGGMIGGFASGTTTAPLPTPAPTVTITQTAEAPEPTAVEDEPADEPAEEPEPAAYTPKKSDWKVRVKETGKQCFGSAGCNVDLSIEPQFVGDSSTLPTSGTIEVTFEVSGAEDPLIDTFTVENKEMSWTKEQSVSTSSKGKVLKAKITEVEYNTY